jgi:hypothetical protein
MGLLRALCGTLLLPHIYPTATGTSASGTDHHHYVLREIGPCLCLITARGIKWHLVTVAAMVACRGDGIQWWTLKSLNPCHFIVVLRDDLYFLGRREGHRQMVKDLARHDEVVSNITELAPRAMQKTHEIIHSDVYSRVCYKSVSDP